MVSISHDLMEPDMANPACIHALLFVGILFVVDSVYKWKWIYRYSIYVAFYLNILFVWSYEHTCYSGSQAINAAPLEPKCRGFIHLKYYNPDVLT